jgi:hypothetical protein
LYKLKKAISVLLLLSIVISGIGIFNVQQSEAIFPIVAALTANQLANYAAGALIVSAVGGAAIYNQEELMSWGNEWLTDCGTAFRNSWQRNINLAYAGGAVLLSLSDLVTQTQWDKIQTLVTSKNSTSNILSYSNYTMRIKYYWWDGSPGNRSWTYMSYRWYNNTWNQTDSLQTSGSTTVLANAMGHMMETFWAAQSRPNWAFTHDSISGLTEAATSYENQYFEIPGNPAYGFPTGTTIAEQATLRLPGNTGDYTDPNKTGDIIVPPPYWPSVDGQPNVPVKSGEPTLDTTDGMTKPWAGSNTSSVPGAGTEPSTEVGWLDWLWHTLLTMAGTLSDILAYIRTLITDLVTALSLAITTNIATWLQPITSRMDNQGGNDPPPSSGGTGSPILNFFPALLALIWALIIMFVNGLGFIDDLLSIQPDSSMLNSYVIAGINQAKTYGYDGLTFYNMVNSVAALLFGLLMFRLMKRLVIGSGSIFSAHLGGLVADQKQEASTLESRLDKYVEWRNYKRERGVR